jgi:hypothetical protein
MIEGRNGLDPLRGLSSARGESKRQTGMRRTIMLMQFWLALFLLLPIAGIVATIIACKPMAKLRHR